LPSFNREDQSDEESDEGAEDLGNDVEQTQDKIELPLDVADLHISEDVAESDDWVEVGAGNPRTEHDDHEHTEN